MNLAALIPSPPGGWRLWGVIAGVALVGFLFWRTYESGKSDGVAQERSSWVAAAYAIGEATQQIGAEEGRSFHRDIGALSATRETGRREIEESADEIRAVLLAWARSDQRLCGTESGPCANRRD